MYNKYLAKRLEQRSVPRMNKIKRPAKYFNNGCATTAETINMMTTWINKNPDKEVIKTLIEGVTPLLATEIHKFRNELPVANIRPRK